MKISIFILSFCGFCIFYICNADWIDEWYEKLINDYLGSDYEEVAPFISSITAGAEEFDRLIEELERSKQKWFPPSAALVSIIVVSTMSFFVYHYAIWSKGRRVMQKSLELISNCYNSRDQTNREEIQNLVMEFLEKKLKNICGNQQKDDEDIPVKMLWKGSTLVESSIHCNAREEVPEPKLHSIQKQILQSKWMMKMEEVEAEKKKTELTRRMSDESTTHKMAEIRRLLESEPEIIQNQMGREEEVVKGWKTGKAEPKKRCYGQQDGERHFRSGPDIERQIRRGEPCDETKKTSNESFESMENKKVESQDEENEKGTSDWEGSPDQKLMNRIRLLESRLRLEELKNKNWINRMSRAEGILQQLNKQVERIEENQPMETLTETLKITSTVTNWALSSHPRRDMQFTLVKQYPPLYWQKPYISLSDVIKREVGLPTSIDRNLYYFPRTPQIPALPISNAIPQPSFLSKFMSK